MNSNLDNKMPPEKYSKIVVKNFWIISVFYSTIEQLENDRRNLNKKPIFLTAQFRYSPPRKLAEHARKLRAVTSFSSYSKVEINKIMFNDEANFLMATNWRIY